MLRHTSVSIVLGLLLTVVCTNPLAAKDCGEQPVDMPPVPDGVNLTREQIVAARDAVVAYSESIDTYLVCMDKRIARLSSYLTKDQRERMSEDMKKLADQRRELQVQINKAIRTWRANRDASGE